jgi:hypothetical protein
MNGTDRVGVSTAEQSDDLDAFAFEPGDVLVRWFRFGNTRPDEKTWTILARTFRYRLTWVRERDDSPTREHHRQYTLWCNETLDRMIISEAELKHGDWRVRTEEVTD